ncbi:MAG: hypothetical protein ABIQ74_12910 [Chitinophagales bacterium]
MKRYAPHLTLITPLIFVTIFCFRVSVAQSSLSLLENRLSKIWRLDHTVQDHKLLKADQSLNDFVMILNADHSVKQGMYPEGLIGGKWSVDEKEMMLTIKDDVTSQNYKMKIASLTATELVLHDPQSSQSVFIHYRAK